jgi:hypothetical protein
MDIDVGQAVLFFRVKPLFLTVTLLMGITKLHCHATHHPRAGAMADNAQLA